MALFIAAQLLHMHIAWFFFTLSSLHFFPHLQFVVFVLFYDVEDRYIGLWWLLHMQSVPSVLIQPSSYIFL